MIRETGEAQHLCVCGSPLAKGVEDGLVCSDCAQEEKPSRELAAAVNLRELGS